jgi:hypothetical protein
MRLKAILDTSSFYLIVDPNRGCARTPKITARLPASSATPGKIVTPLLISNVLVSHRGVLEAVPCTGDEHTPNRDAQKKKCDISELD